MEIRTDDPALIEEALGETKRISKKYKTIRIGAGELAFFDSPVFKKYFRVTKTYEDRYGQFAHLSKDDVPKTCLPDNVSVSLVSNEEKSRYTDYDDAVWDGLSSMLKCGNDTDKLYVLKENGAVCGYLLANNSYKSIYDIGYIFVLEKYRGKNYGQYLAVTYANDCYHNGQIPHYGTARSKYSEAVAHKSGFKELYRRHFVDVKVKKFSII